MINRKDLIKTEEYWFETLQNEIFRIVTDYIQKEGINQTQLADKLGVSKGYISQIMNGNFNFSLKKLIELSLAVNKAPSFDFKDINTIIAEDQLKHFEMKCESYFNVTTQTKTIAISSGETGNAENLQQTKEYPRLKVA